MKAKAPCSTIPVYCFSRHVGRLEARQHEATCGLVGGLRDNPKLCSLYISIMERMGVSWSALVMRRLVSLGSKFRPAGSRTRKPESLPAHEHRSG